MISLVIVMTGVKVAIKVMRMTNLTLPSYSFVFLLFSSLGHLDVDECLEGKHHCHHNSLCINMPGWYYCQCKKGFHSRTYVNGSICEGQ